MKNFFNLEFKTQILVKIKILTTQLVGAFFVFLKRNQRPPIIIEYIYIKEFKTHEEIFSQKKKKKKNIWALTRHVGGLKEKMTGPIFHYG